MTVLPIFERLGPRAMLRLTGHVDHHAAPQLDGLLEHQPLGDLTELDVDLSRVNFISSTGFNFLVRLRKAVQPGGGRVRLLWPQPQVMACIHLMHLDRLFTVVSSPA